MMELADGGQAEVVVAVAPDPDWRHLTCWDGINSALQTFSPSNGADQKKKKSSSEI